MRSKVQVIGGCFLLRVMESVDPATTVDRAAINKLLVEAGLPTDDLDTAPVRFWVAREGRNIIGAIGLEAVELLVLLTQTAQAFFEGRGYLPTVRTDLPASIQQTAEFKSLCPANAVCLSKRLAP